VGQQPDHRAQHPGHHVDDRSHREGDALGALEGDPLGRQLAEDEAEERDHDGDRDQRRGPRDGLGHPPVLQDRFEVLGQGGGAERGRKESRQRHADLQGRQEGVGVVGEPGHRLPASPALLHRPHLAVPQRDQRQLGGREQPTDQDEDQDQRDVDPDVAHGTPA